MKTVKIAIFGFGVIGRGFAQVLLDKFDYIKGDTDGCQ